MIKWEDIKVGAVFTRLDFDSPTGFTSRLTIIDKFRYKLNTSDFGTFRDRIDFAAILNKLGYAKVDGK